MTDLKRIPWTTLALSLFALLVAVLNLQPALELTASLNDPWRLWSGHFTHWSRDHLCWDLAVFVALGSFCEPRQRRAFLGLVGLGAVAMSVPLLTITDTYRGLSGLDTGLFALAGCILAQTAIRERNGRMLIVVLLAALAFVGKSGFEAATGMTLFVDSGLSGFQPLVSAHVLGALAGLVCFGIFQTQQCEERTGFLTRHFLRPSTFPPHSPLPGDFGHGFSQSETRAEKSAQCATSGQPNRGWLR